MATEVIMPALGMAQETGKLLTWLKEPGDAVQAGEILFEVETDKSVAEVEAQADGFLTDVTASPGQDVPVGQRIAMISQTAEDSAPTPVAADPEPVVPEPEQAKPSAAAPVAAAPLITDRVLASPKARRLAAEESLDLSRLQQAGHPQPYHVSDLAILRGLSGDVPAAAQIATHQITAQVPADGVTAFLDRMASEGGITLPASAVLCNFTAAAWRSVTQENSFVLGLMCIGQSDRHLVDPDRYRLSAQPEDAGDAPVSLILRDLSGSAITSMQIGAASAPLVNVASDTATYTLTFTFTPDQMADDAAIVFVTDLTARIADPMPHLV